MTKYEHESPDRLDRLADSIAEAIEEASDEELVELLDQRGVDPINYVAGVRAVIDQSVSIAMRKRFDETRAVIRSMAHVDTPSISEMTKEQLIEELRNITANDQNSEGVLTIAARSGRAGITVEELRSIIEDYYSLQRSGRADG